MDLVERAKKICLTPNTEWDVIAAEPTPTATLMTGYVIPLAAIGAIAGFIGRSFIGISLPFMGTYRVPVVGSLIASIFAIVGAVVGVFVIGLVINALAPTFGAQKNSEQALKVAVYSFTPSWIAAILTIMPMLSMLAILGSLYGLYLLYLGLPKLMKNPEDKSLAYTATVVICAIIVMIVIGAFTAIFAGAGALAGGALGGGLTGSAPASENVEFDPNSPMGKLEQFGKAMEESAKKMEAAEKSGDQGAQAAAAMEGLGTLFGGGKRVDPVNIEQLKPFVPATFAGLPRVSSSAEKTGMGPIMVSKAEATYGDGAGKEVTLEITDTGGVSGLMGLASWMGVQGEKETADGFERTQKVGNRLVHEKTSKSGRNEFALVIGDRFMVNASGRLDLNALKTAVSSLELGKLEAMKAVGVQP